MISSPMISHHRKFVVSNDLQPTQQRFSPNLTKRNPVEDAFDDDFPSHSPMLQRYSKFNTSVIKYPNPMLIGQRFTTVKPMKRRSNKATLNSVFQERNDVTVGSKTLETVEISSTVENCNTVIPPPTPEKPLDKGENWLLLDSNLPLNSNPINYGDLATVIESTEESSPKRSVSRGTTTDGTKAAVAKTNLRRGRSLTHGKLNLYRTPSLQDSINGSYRGYSQSEPKLRPQPSKPAIFEVFNNNDPEDECCCHCAQRQWKPDVITNRSNIIRLSIDKGSPVIGRHLKCPNSILKSSKSSKAGEVRSAAAGGFNCGRTEVPVVERDNPVGMGSDSGIVATTPSIPAIRISSACSSLSPANSNETLALAADPFEVQTVTVVADFDESDWEMPESPKSQLDFINPPFDSQTSRSHTPTAESLSSGSLYQRSLRGSLKSARFQSCPDLLQPCLNDFKTDLKTNLLDRAKRKKKSRGGKTSRSDLPWGNRPLVEWKLDDILLWLQHLGQDQLASVLVGYDVTGVEVASWTAESLESFGATDTTREMILAEINKLKEIQTESTKKKSISTSPSLYNVLSCCESDYDVILPVELTGGPTVHNFSVAENPSGGLTVTSVKAEDLPLCVGDCIVELDGQRTLFMAAVDFSHQLRRKGKHKLVILRRNFGLTSRMSMQSLLNGNNNGFGEILSSMSTSPVSQPPGRDDFDILHF